MQRYYVTLLHCYVTTDVLSGQVVVWPQEIPGAAPPLAPGYTPIHPDIVIVSLTQLPTGWQSLWIWIFSCVRYSDQWHQTLMTPWSQSYSTNPCSTNPCSTNPCSVRLFIIYHMSFKKGLSVTMNNNNSLRNAHCCCPAPSVAWSFGKPRNVPKLNLLIIISRYWIQNEHSF